ncbi:GH18 domain-containing protein [Entamoeba marina]
MNLLIITILLSIQSFAENVAITDFNSIPFTSRTFPNKIYAVTENDEALYVASKQEVIDNIIPSVHQIYIKQSDHNIKTIGKWEYNITSEDKIGLFSILNFHYVPDLTFKIAEAVVNDVISYNYTGACITDIEEIFYSTGRSLRDVRLSLRRIGIELHKINKKLFVIIPPKTHSIGFSEVSQLEKYVDEFIIEHIEHYEVSYHTSYATSPIIYVNTTLNDFSRGKSSLINKLSMVIDLRGYKYCGKQRSAVNATEFYVILKDAQSIHWDDVVKEHYVIDSNGCTVVYPTVETIQARIDLAIQRGVDITLYNVDYSHPNVFNLF